jgi:hypothetical protein
MTWERRRSPGGRFLYRSERCGGKVVKTYIGSQSSAIVRLISRIDRNVQALGHINQGAERAENAAERGRLLRAYDTRFGLVVALHRRSDAMKTRARSTQSAPPPSVNGLLPTQGEFLALVTRAEKGSDSAQAELRNLLDLNPQLWRPLGDLGNLVEVHLIDLATRTSLLMRESLQRHLADVREQLMNGGSNPLLGFLVHRVLVSWLEVEVRQIQAMQFQGEPANQKYQRRLDLAQRRHLESVMALRDFHHFSWGNNDRVAATSAFLDPTAGGPPASTTACA